MGGGGIPDPACVRPVRLSKGTLARRHRTIRGRRCERSAFVPPRENKKCRHTVCTTNICSQISQCTLRTTTSRFPPRGGSCC